MTSAGVSVPRQERSRESFARIRDAALKLLAEHGKGDFTLADVSREASVSIGTIYGRVGSKATLLRVVQEQSLDEIDAELTSQLRRAGREETTFAEAVSSVVSCYVGLLHTHAAKIRAFMSLGGDDPESEERGRLSWETGRDEFCRALAAAGKANGVTSTEVALDWCHELVYSVAARHFGFGLTAGGLANPLRDPSELARELGRTVHLVLASDRL